MELNLLSGMVMLIVSMNGAKQGKYQLQHNGIQAVFLTPKIERLFRKKNI
jgi:hypothetical protein